MDSILRSDLQPKFWKVIHLKILFELGFGLIIFNRKFHADVFFFKFRFEKKIIFSNSYQNGNISSYFELSMETEWQRRRRRRRKFFLSKYIIHHTTVDLYSLNWIFPEHNKILLRIRIFTQSLNWDFFF